MGRDISSELKRITELKLSSEEQNTLADIGISIKNPTKLTLLAAALYEKASKGDLSALKEVFSRLNPDGGEKGEVVLIDDIKNSTK